jgi:hypothetical protein
MVDYSIMWSLAMFLMVLFFLLPYDVLSEF